MQILVQDPQQLDHLHPVAYIFQNTNASLQHPPSTGVRCSKPTTNNSCTYEQPKSEREFPSVLFTMASFNSPANFAAYTAPINPPSANPKLTLDQVWTLLRRKDTNAEEFVPVAIKATEVVSVEKDGLGRPVRTRIVTFVEGDKRVQELVTELYPMMLQFRRMDGSMVQNIVSQGPEGELYLTFTFELVRPTAGVSEAEVETMREKQQAGAKMAVEGTLKAMREMVLDGRWEKFA